MDSRYFTYEDIAHVVAEFDFAKVERVMAELDWKWSGHLVTKHDLIDCACRLLQQVAERDGMVSRRCRGVRRQNDPLIHASRSEVVKNRPFSRRDEA